MNYLSEIKNFLSESGFFLGVCGFSLAEVGEKKWRPRKFFEAEIIKDIKFSGAKKVGI